jgi:hypothetical protein
LAFYGEIKRLELLQFRPESTLGCFENPERAMNRKLLRSVAVLGIATSMFYPTFSYSDDKSYRVAEGCTFDAWGLGLDSIVEIVRDNPPRTREIFQRMREAFVEAVTNSGDCEFESGVADISEYQRLNNSLEGQEIAKILRLEVRRDEDGQLVIIVKPI